MTEVSPTPEAKRTPKQRAVYIALTLALVIGALKGISAFREPDKPYDNSSPLVRKSQNSVQYDLKDFVPDESGRPTLPGNEVRPTIVLDIPFATHVPEASAKLELFNPAGEGVWVALDKFVVNDMTVFMSRDDQLELRSLKDAGSIDFVSNGTIATMLKGSQVGVHLVEIQSGTLQGRQVFVEVNNVREVK